VKLHFFAPAGLEIPPYVRSDLDALGTSYTEQNDFNDKLGKVDALYVTRLQKERFFSEEEYFRMRNSYSVNKETLEKAKEGMLVLHPLPRNEEIHPEVDTTPNAGYFRQARYGLQMRMALISLCLGVLP
jgi:aspartate carbamoyltransferase catalytic subunit